MDNENVEYEQKVLPDKKRLSMVLQEAKGTERTMAQLAEACGTSASSLSRILTGKITKPLSMDLLKAIAENSASPGVTLDVLAKANGMRPKREYGSDIYAARRRQAMEESRDREMSVRNMISNALLNRGCNTQILLARPYSGSGLPQKESAFWLSVRWSCLIKTDAFRASKIDRWGIITDPSYARQEDLEHMRRYNLWQMGRFYSPIFLSDLWEPELYQGVKISFAFVDSFFYNEFIQTYGNQKVNNCMSAILVDIQKGEIVEEKAFGRIGGGTCPLLQDIPEIDYDYGEEGISWGFPQDGEDHPWAYKDSQNKEHK